MMIKDWEDTGDPEIEWEEITDFSDFAMVPEVGVVPTYWEEELLDDYRSPDWESVIYEIYEYKIYKLLWFVVADMAEFDDHEVDVFPLDDFEKTVKAAETRAWDHDTDQNDYFFSWESRIFSNGKKFSAGKPFSDPEISELEEVEFLPALGWPIPQDLRTTLLHSSEGEIFVGVNTGTSISIMPVDSEEEARIIMSEIWQ